MAYCVQSDIEKLIPVQELAELTTESGSTPDSDVVAEAIVKADAEIDSYLGIIYSVPLSVPPTRVKALSEDIAIYYLYMRRSSIPEARQKAYDNGIAFLQLLAAGKATIPDDSGGGGTSGNQGVQFASAPSIFNRDSMTSW
jgi:phage gp36-like protein